MKFEWTVENPVAPDPESIVDETVSTDVSDMGACGGFEFEPAMSDNPGTFTFEVRWLVLIGRLGGAYVLLMRGFFQGDVCSRGRRGCAGGLRCVGCYSVPRLLCFY